MPGETVDGGDILSVFEVMQRAAERARSGEGPTLVCAKVARFTSHSSDDDQRRYRPQEELEALLRRDPIERFRNYLLDEHVIDEASDERLQQECAAEVEAALATAENAEAPSPDELLDNLFAEEQR
jgi:2-oxoisovalerate dehydrogenase E1 component alpha subunit